MHNTITCTNSAGGLCPVTNRGHCDHLATIHSVPRGNVETMRNPTAKREVLISPWYGLAAYQERWYQDPLEQMKNTAQLTFYQAHLTLIVPGSLNICGAMGMVNNCGISEQCLDRYRSGQSFIFLLQSPLRIGAAACLPNLTFIINDYLVRFEYCL